MGLEMARVALERKAETIGRPGNLAGFKLQNSQVAIGISHVLARSYCLAVDLGGSWVRLVLQDQSLFKRADSSRKRDQPALFRFEKIPLSLQGDVYLRGRHPGRSHLSDPAELGQGPEVIDRFTAFRVWDGLNYAFLRPAANYPASQAE